MKQSRSVASELVMGSAGATQTLLHTSGSRGQELRGADPSALTWHRAVHTVCALVPPE